MELAEKIGAAINANNGKCSVIEEALIEALDAVVAITADSVIVDVEFEGKQVFRYESPICPRVGECVSLMQCRQRGGMRRYRVTEVEHLVSNDGINGPGQTQARINTTTWEG
jgi:hypothetical protein